MGDADSAQVKVAQRNMTLTEASLGVSEEWCSIDDGGPYA